MRDDLFLWKPSRREVIAGLASLLAVPSTRSLADATMQTVVDLTGRIVTIPKRPQRIVSMFDVPITLPLYELGVTIVGSARTGNDLYYFEELFGQTAAAAGIADLGYFRSPDLERVAALQPDLIIAEASIDGLDAMARIAPVYVVPFFSDAAPGIGAVNELAMAIGFEQVVMETKVTYDARVVELRDTMERHQNLRTYLAIMPGSEILVMSGPGALQQVTNDLGLAEPEWLTMMRGGMKQHFAISRELISQADADLVILLTQYNDEKESNAQADAAMDAFLPGWDRFLPAAREDRLVRLSGRLAIIPTYGAAHRILDDIELQLVV